MFQYHEEQTNEILNENIKSVLQIEIEKNKSLMSNYENIFTVNYCLIFYKC